MKWPECATDKRSVERVRAIPMIEEIILPEHEAFLEIVKGLLEVDP